MGRIPIEAKRSAFIFARLTTGCWSAAQFCDKCGDPPCGRLRGRARNYVRTDERGCDQSLVALRWRSTSARTTCAGIYLPDPCRPRNPKLSKATLDLILMDSGGEKPLRESVDLSWPH